MERLRADLVALSVRHPEPDAGLRLLGARRAARVQVRGAGRVGAAVAALLSAAGVGQVDVRDGGCVEPWDVLPAGSAPDQIGERRDAAARRLVRSAATARRSPHAPAEPRGLSLVVLAPRDGLGVYAPEPDTAEPLITTGTRICTPRCWRTPGWWARWWCRGQPAARRAWPSGARSGSPAGPGCWPSGSRAAGRPLRPATRRRWSRRWPGWLRHRPWPSSTVGRHPAWGPGWSSHCRD